MINSDADNTEKSAISVNTPYAAMVARRKKVPVAVTPDLKAQIIERLHAGQFITDICSDPLMPSLSGVFKARKADADFDALYREGVAACLDAAMTDGAAFAVEQSQLGDDKAQRVADIYSTTMARIAEKLSPSTHGVLLKVAGADGGALTVAVVQYADTRAKPDDQTTG